MVAEEDILWSSGRQAGLLNLLASPLFPTLLNDSPFPLVSNLTSVV